MIFSACFPSFAADTGRAARVADLSGTVTVTKAGGEKQFAAFKGMSLAQGDEIATGKGAWVSIEMDGDKTIKLDENTRMAVSELQGAAGGEQQTGLGLWLGKVWTSIKQKLNVRSKFEVKTPTTVMGVRGTQFLTTSEPGQTGVTVLEGTISAAQYTVTTTTNGTTGQQVVEVTINKDQQAVLAATVAKASDVKIEQVTQEMLDLFVLKTIRDNPEGVNPDLLKNIDSIIRQKQQEKDEADKKAEEERRKQQEQVGTGGQGNNGGGADGQGSVTPTYDDTVTTPTMPTGGGSGGNNGNGGSSSGNPPPDNPPVQVSLSDVDAFAYRGTVHVRGTAEGPDAVRVEVCNMKNNAVEKSVEYPAGTDGTARFDLTGEISTAVNGFYYYYKLTCLKGGAVVGSATGPLISVADVFSGIVTVDDASYIKVFASIRVPAGYDAEKSVKDVRLTLEDAGGTVVYPSGQWDDPSAWTVPFAPNGAVSFLIPEEPDVPDGIYTLVLNLRTVGGNSYGVVLYDVRVLGGHIQA